MLCDMVVWLGTEPYRDATPVMEWLKANGIDGSEIPLHSTIGIKGDEILFTRVLLTLDGKVRVTVNDEPAVESASAPLTVAWPLEVAA